MLGVVSKKKTRDRRVPHRFLVDLARRCKACLAISEFIEEALQLSNIEYEQSLCLIDDGFGVYEIMDDDDPIEEGETGVPVLEGDIAMASRGRHGAQTREDEQRREERGEQQAPTPKGPTVLPSPPPVDYGVLMQGLTQVALQAQLQAQAQAPAPVPQEYGHGGPSIMERFKRMAPPSFKGES
ncbi:hypothetical protein Taro_002676 [Colocasia esculenta]|uniref:Uncharacterized protein n=1 Tax=Colocasia esculenta TaxID=4460 RepID=A0A843TLL9_COLES|nr:hypothetical protein [Colocasia esculenta]